MKAFDRARHSHEVTETDQVTLNLDHVQSGLGGDDSWSPATHEEYLIFPESYTYQIRTRPVDLSKVHPSARYQEKLPDMEQDMALKAPNRK